jgi:hypothetical protein
MDNLGPLLGLFGVTFEPVPTKRLQTGTSPVDSANQITVGQDDLPARRDVVVPATP